MKKLLMATASVLICVAASAQTVPVPMTTPPGLVIGPQTPFQRLISPEVSTDRRVTFRFYAPMAKSVVVKPAVPGLPSEIPLIKDAAGVWSVTTAQAGPGVYRYRFLVDDALVADPRNHYILPMHFETYSLVEVPGGVDDLQTYRDGIAHGRVVEQYYDSSVAGPQRRMHVYLPPGYDEGNNYPVLYLLHGGGDTDAGWITEGRAGVILDNLIADGKAKKMVVIFPDGVVRGSMLMTSDPAQDKFGAELTNVIIPYIEANYKVSKRAEDRALAGLSMGGIQTLNIGLTHTRMFPYIGVFSSGWFPNDLTAFEVKYGDGLKADTAKLKLFWIGHGTTDIARNNSLAMMKMFDRHGVKYSWEETPGGHDMVTWRLYLSQFAPLLFRN